MSEASEFKFPSGSRRKDKSSKTPMKKTSSDSASVKSDSKSSNHEDAASVYSAETINSEYEEAYNMLRREPLIEESNDVCCLDEPYNVTEVEKPPKPRRNIEVLRYTQSDNQDMLEKISELTLEIEKLKTATQPVGVDAAFNQVLRNVDNLNTRQKQALVNAIINSMN
uniref:Nonstructural protein 5 n=1 Tax=Porcine rotavirus B TaxID=449582 RepID=K4Q0N7_9REOV|nr:nonstructural protein 5 [Porcine rotavirus B]